MADKNTPGDKKLSVPSKTLTLKPRVETGTVRQSFPHGRSKQVVVEKRGKRRLGADAPGGAEAPHAIPEPAVAKATPAAAKAPIGRTATTPTPAVSPRGSGVVLQTLTEDEHAARVHALADARIREQEERRQAEEEAKRRASREGIEQAEREAAEARRKAEEERHRVEEEARRKAEQEAKRRFGENVAAAAAAARAQPAAAAAPAATAARAPAPAARAPVPGRAPSAVAEAEEDEGPRLVRRGPGGALRPAAAPKTTHKPAPQKQRGRLTLVTALDADDVRERSIASFRRRTQRLKGHASNEPKEKLVSRSHDSR